ncbi:3'-5' exoribonuclease domain-containing protein [Vibrio sinaloensis]|uniref:3'-5' exoribonuclease Rv2179c-like domain-containing protein n=1 Tax=Photobacterium sp. (strain ATCC 43367) TaxID=379097 RepID=A0A0A5I3E7_PHOS4|nr:3'-5' exoribonuclease [Vibrio sinaloensis]KGY10361.1 hypothetical protein NM06_05490 [Vibrio sinaloensis]
MRVFFDTEFTQLTQNAQLLSIAFVDQDGRSFYAEFARQHGQPHEPWVKENVVAHMRWLSLSPAPEPFWQQEQDRWFGYDSDERVAAKLAEWLSAYEHVELWADCPAYDWVLVCELFGGSLSLPQPLTYVVNDFATLLTWQGVDPLTPREALLTPDTLPSGILHNALYDAQLLKLCFDTLLSKRAL